MRLPSYPVEGQPITAEWGRRLVDYLRSERLQPGRGYFRQGGAGGRTMKILPRSKAIGGAFSGNVWVNKRRYTGYNSKPVCPWVKIEFTSVGPNITEEIGPPPTNIPDDQIWYEKKFTYGDIRCDRLG
jgi:hypothetical protein